MSEKVGVIDAEGVTPSPVREASMRASGVRAVVTAQKLGSEKEPRMAAGTTTDAVEKKREAIIHPTASIDQIRRDLGGIEDTSSEPHELVGFAD